MFAFEMFLKNEKVLYNIYQRLQKYSKRVLFKLNCITCYTYDIYFDS